MDKFIKSTGRDPYLIDPNDFNPGFFGHLNALVDAITVLQNTGGGGPGGLSSILVSQGALTIPATQITITGTGATLSDVGGVAYLNIPATRGPQGFTGATGATGLPGSIGPAGPQGVPGPRGPQGIQGNIGLTGDAGETGPGGPPGPDGIDGNKYKTTSTTSRTIVSTGTFTFTVADSDLAYTAGQSVVIANSATRLMTANVDGYTGNVLTVTINGSSGSGTFTSWDINLQGIQGPTGPPGSTGPGGATGPQGLIGITGAAGAQGNAGAAGPAGATGPQGPIGFTGAPGAAGAKWFDVAVDPNGAGNPAGSIVGDFALQLNGQTWEKQSMPSTWVAITNIKGAAGAPGPAGPAGTAKTVIAFVVDGYGGPIVALAPGVTVFVLKIPFIGTYTGLTITTDQNVGVGNTITLDITGFVTGGPVSLAITGASSSNSSTPATTVTAATTLTFKVTNSANSPVTRFFVNLTGERS
jgi:hypothetical protein